MVFYDQEWKRFGTRSDLSGDLNETIGIPQNVLHKKLPVSSASIAQKMSWASTRRASRKEDTAYCLLGLFDINMPLLYGEGDKAFLRLQLEIIQSNDDETFFTWRRGGDNIPARHNSGLLARSPRHFRHCSDTAKEPVNEPFIRRAASYTVTDRGLQFRTTTSEATDESIVLSSTP